MSGNVSAAATPTQQFEPAYSRQACVDRRHTRSHTIESVHREDDRGRSPWRSVDYVPVESRNGSDTFSGEGGERWLMAGRRDGRRR